jgi:hypothetical protein
MADHKKIEPKEGRPALDIDYDNPDVEDIMRQIQAGIETPVPAAAAPEPSEAAAAAARVALSPDLSAPEYVPLALSGAQRLLLKLLRPLAPVIKLLVLPVHHELRESVHRLDFTNRRLDFLNQKSEQTLDALSKELYSSTGDLDRKIDGFNDAANRRMDKAFDELGKTMADAKEYIKLLHSLSHNMVVELSKLKIEEEDIKVKARILEKDFEHLRSREKALEDQVVK